jgi:hypothetical protein
MLLSLLILSKMNRAIRDAKSNDFSNISVSRVVYYRVTIGVIGNSSDLQPG